MDEAYQRGFESRYLLSNPYPDLGPGQYSDEARRFVDGWAAGRKWALSQSVGQLPCAG